jgi:N-acylglucosamine 2-epimerase
MTGCTRFEKAREIGAFYREKLLREIVPFWETRTRDSEYGGFLTGFDCCGNLTDPKKYIWPHGRQTWMFSALCNEIGKRENWLALAKQGRDYLVGPAYAGNGRWHYLLERNGNVLKSTISIYTDMFALAALAEYAVASGSGQDLPLIREAFGTMERNLHDPMFKDIYHGTWVPGVKRFGLPMIAICTAMIVRNVLGAERTKPMIDFCLDEILHVFSRDKEKATFEALCANGEFLDTPEGRTLNPGHVLEGAWFCLEEAKIRRDRSLLERVRAIADRAYATGYDREFGGIHAFVALDGKEPATMDYHRKTDMRWDDKSFWVHAESLYALAAIAVAMDDEIFWNRFLDLHEWCWTHFYDRKNGEWFPVLARDGTPRMFDHGKAWKCLYHLPRAMMMLSKLLQK